MAKKLRVGILFGGKSAEHEVALQSAKNVVEAIDKAKYEVTLIGIDKTGKWLLPNQAQFLLNATDPKLIALNKQGEQAVALAPEQGSELIDVVFPILHGPFGEDGTVQGLLKLANVPFVGASVLGSAVGMDKDVTKRLLRDAGIPIGKFLSFKSGEQIDLDQIIKELGLPLFIKPANMGSSVGVSKAKDKSELAKAIELAWTYDTKILIEEFISGRELECAVLGNDQPSASILGEVIPHHEFYSYEAKYLDENGAALEVPAKIPDEVTKQAQALAIKVFKTLEVEGMARVDFFLTKDNHLLVNEINTIPGFTKISMYPRLWAATGLSYPQLIDRLIELAIERFEKERGLKTS